MRSLFLAITFLAACSSPSKQAPPPVEPAPVDPAPAIDAAPTTPALALDGAACLAATDCASGVCEGAGCGTDAPGVCKPTARACTKDLREYCGCDGKIFQSSGSCPGQRFNPDTAACKPAKVADGGNCLAADECVSGVCEGLGCTDDKPGTCAPAQRGCTRDLRSYCGCDGVTFKGSGSCPGQRYSAKAACAKAK